MSRRQEGVAIAERRRIRADRSTTWLPDKVLAKDSLRDLLLGAGGGSHLAGLALLAAVMLAVLVPLDMRLLRRRVLGD